MKILKALSVQPRVLIMDEPTSMFNVEDAAKVLELTKRITEKRHRHHLYFALPQ